MSKDTPAFPQFEMNDDGTGYCRVEGLTKRQWYAGMAMQGLLADAELARALRKTTKADEPSFEAALASACFEIAAAMIAHEESE